MYRRTSFKKIQEGEYSACLPIRLDNNQRVGSNRAQQLRCVLKRKEGDDGGDDGGRSETACRLVRGEANAQALELWCAEQVEDFARIVQQRGDHGKVARKRTVHISVLAEEAEVR